MGYGRKPDLARDGNLRNLLDDFEHAWLTWTQLMAIAHVVAVHHACTRGYGEGWMDKFETNDRSAIMKVRRIDRTFDNRY
jgi:hypothetical protein